MRSTGPATSSSSSGRVSGQIPSRSRSEACARRARLYSRWRITPSGGVAQQAFAGLGREEVEARRVDREPDRVADLRLRPGVDARGEERPLALGQELAVL